MLFEDRTMASSTSMNSEDLFGNVDQTKLDQPCKREHLLKISESISGWEELAPYLDLDEVEIGDIKEEYHTQKRRRQVMIGKWKEKNGMKATYRKLARVFVSQGLRHLAEKLCAILMEETSSDDNPESENKKPSETIITRFGDHLRGIYHTKLTSNCLNMPNFLPSHTCMVFNLALIGHERIQYGTEIMKRMQEILNNDKEEDQEIKEVKLENIFKSYQCGRRQFTLLEGAPGAGKSALACFICQKWEAGELFQEFHLVIFVQLNDPRIQSAQSLADILHDGSYFDTRLIMSNLQSTQGKGVLFVMDSWDEYPLQLEEDSLINNLIVSPDKLSMQLSAVVVTSRPVASGKLQRYCSSRFEIIGYKQDELECFFREALQNNPQKIAKLKESLDTMPLIKKSCRLPLYATIVAHIFKCSDGSLPTTLYDLYRILVSSIIHRHMVKLERSCDLDPSDEKYLCSLPHPFCKHFTNLCKLAFDGVTKNKTNFSVDDLKSCKISPESSLSLLHGVPSFISFKQSIFYSFMHLMIQEFLAAHYILQLSLDNQIEAFQPLFGQPRFVAVFQFYASKANFDQDQSASLFCYFFARIFREIRSHVDRNSQKLPRKWQGDLEQLKNVDPQVFYSELSSIDPTSIPQPLSSFDPVHIVLYVSLPYFDVGYVLASLSVSCNRELKFDICICVRDDVMMYVHVSGVRIVAKSQSATMHEASVSSPPPYIYRSFDIVGLITSDMNCDSTELLQRLPKGCSIIKDRFLVMSYFSPIFLPGVSSIFNADVDFDYSNILVVFNSTSEEQMQSVHQEFETFKQNCLVQ